jgi:hypothetical protein
MLKGNAEARYMVAASLAAACMQAIVIWATANDLLVKDSLPVTYAILLLDIILPFAALKNPAWIERILARYRARFLFLSVIGFILGWIFYDTMPMRRVFFANITLFALLPAVRPLIGFAAPLRTGGNQPMARILLFLLLAVLIVPGFVLPPFWDGIPGWRSGRVTTPKEAIINGYQLVRDDGASVWYSPSILGTITYFGSWNNRASLSPETLREFEEFLWRRYKTNYPLLEQGRSPNQRYFGKLAFPHHTPFRMFDYAPFPPSRIRSIDFVTERFDVASGKLLERITTQSLKVRE